MKGTGFYLENFFHKASKKSWRRVPAKVFLREVDIRSETGDEEVLGLSGSRGVLKRSEMGQRASEATSYIGYKKVAPGQLISNKMQAWNGMFGVSPYEGITSPDYAIYEFISDNDARFIEYTARTALYAAEFQCRSKGMGTGFLRLNPGAFLATPFWLPDRETKKAIADFLDRETARIDQLIEKKQRLVELVDEKRAALITAAVTGQIVPETGFCLAPSGGGGVSPQAGLKIPFHRPDWQTCRLKFLLERRSRLVRDDDGIVTAFRDGVVTLRSRRREEGFTFADKEIGYQGVEPGDLVIHAMDGFAGAIGVSDSRGKCSPVYSIVTPKQGATAHPRFWAYYLRNLAITGFIESLAKGIRERSTDFRWRDAGNLLVNYPGLESQKAIANFLDRETARLGTLKAKTGESIDRLRELRSALITAAVTGQIDVTTWGKRGESDRRLDKIEEEMTAGSGDEEPMEARA